MPAPGREARQSRTYASTIASMEKAATRARAASPRARRRCRIPHQPQERLTEGVHVLRRDEHGGRPVGVELGHRGEPVGHGGERGGHRLEHGHRAPLAPGGLGIHVQPGQELRGAVHHLAEEMGPCAQRGGGLPERPVERALADEDQMRLGDVPEPADHRLDQEVRPLLRVHATEVPHRHRAGGQAHPGAGPRALLGARRSGQGHAVPDGDHRGAGGNPAPELGPDLGAAGHQRAAEARAEAGRSALPSRGRRELVEGGEHPGPRRESACRHGVEPGADVMGMGHRGAGQRAGELPEGLGGHASYRAERRHRDAGRLRPGADRSVLAEGDQRGLDAERPRAGREVHHQSLQPTDLEAVDDVCHLHRLRVGRWGLRACPAGGFGRRCPVPDTPGPRGQFS